MFAVVLISALLSTVLAVYNQWTWISGASGTDGTEYYQNIGSYSKQTTPAAKLSFSSAYGKNHRRLYVFGGYGKPVSGPDYRGVLNDLWSYDTETEQWAFWGRGYDLDDKGLYVDRGRFSTGYPGPRDNAMMVFDESNKLIYIYGGLVENYNNIQALDDLWVYNTTSNQFKWLGGNEPGEALVFSDTPSPRMVPGYVEDTITGNVYLPETFALVQEDTDYALYRHRKTWIFNVNYANWTMLDKDFPLTNYSQSSLSYDSLTDNIIVFAGYDNEVGNNIMSSDTFYYNTISKSWSLARKGGTDSGTYGNRLEVSPTSFPGARSKHFSDIDKAQRRLIVFGGVGYGVTFGTRGYLNDLWIYDLDKYTWTWIAGSRSVDQTQRITEKGQSGPLVSPGGKASGVGFYDEISQRFYIFGGNEKPSRPGEIILSNQVWYFDFKYIPPITSTIAGIQTTTQSSVTTSSSQVINSQTMSTRSSSDAGSGNLNNGQNGKSASPNDVIIPVAAVILSVLFMLSLILYTYQRIKRRMMDDLKELEAAESKRRKSESKATQPKKHTPKRHSHDTDKESRRNSSRRESEDDMPTKKRQNAVQSDEEDFAYDRSRKRSSNHSIEETRNSVRGGKTKSSLDQQDNGRRASSSEYKQREKTASSHRFV